MKKKMILCSMLAFFLIVNTARSDEKLASSQTGRTLSLSTQHIVRARSSIENISADEQDNYDVKAYALHLDIDPEAKRIAGKMNILAASTEKGVSEIIVNLDAAFSIDSVGNDASGFGRQGDKIVITLKTPKNRDALFSVGIFYSGNPMDAIGDNEAGMVMGKRGDTYAVYTDNAPWFARNWFPCKDVPWDKADSSDMIITVPSGLTVASNGLLRSQTDNPDGTTTFSWHESYPIATYLMSLAITDYKVFTDTYISASGDSMMLQHFVFPEDLEDARIDFSRTPQMIGFFASLFGEYPFIREKYGMAEYNGIYAGMENQTMTHVDPGYIRGNHSSDDLIAHELSHQWWGDCVTMGDWPQTWLNEGFATYCEALWEEHVHGEQAYRDYMHNILRSAKGFKEPIYRFGNRDVYSLIVYDKGAAVMHMLRHVMGDEKFFQVFPIYLERFKYSNALTKDFESVCEEVYGQDLGWFFDEWIMGASFPKYAVSWRKGAISGGPGMGISGFISQVQEENRIYIMPVDITFYAGNKDTTITAFVDRQGAPFGFLWKVPLDTPIDSVIIDKENWILHGLGEMPSYQNVIIDHYYFREKEGNGNGVLEPDESAELVVFLQNLGDSLSNVTGTLSTDDENISIENNISHFGNMGLEEHKPVAAWGDLFKINIASTDTSRLAAFYLDITSDEGFSKRDSFFIRIGFPQYLWVNGSGNEAFQSIYEQAMQAGRFNLDFISGEEAAENPDTLKKYRAIIWCTDDRRFDPLLPQEQVAIGAFLDAGGNLLLSGENVLFGLLFSGRRSDSVFVRKYLHADLMSEPIKASLVLAEKSDSTFKAIRISLRGKYGIENQYQPDGLIARDDAEKFLRFFPGNKTAGIRFANSQYRIIVLGFGLEGVCGPKKSTLADFLQKSFRWLNRTTTFVRDGSTEHLPTTFHLFANYPNPFNGSTQITFSVPVKAAIKLEIFNMLGQKVTTLVDKSVFAGTYNLVWDGINSEGEKVAAGVYTIRMSSKRRQRIHKMLYLP